MKSLFVLTALAAACAPACAGDGILDDLLAYYSQRTEGVTIGAGDAKETNSAIQAINPRPPYANNRNIPADGERMSRAIGRYRDVTKLNEAARAPALEGIATNNSGASSSSGR